MRTLYVYSYSFKIKTETGKMIFFCGNNINSSKASLKRHLKEKYGKLYQLEIRNKGQY